MVFNMQHNSVKYEPHDSLLGNIQHTGKIIPKNINYLKTNIQFICLQCEILPRMIKKMLKTLSRQIITLLPRM